MTDATTWLPLTPMERRILAIQCIQEVYKDIKDDEGKKVDVGDLLVGTAGAVWSESTATDNA